MTAHIMWLTHKTISQPSQEAFALFRICREKRGSGYRAKRVTAVAEPVGAELIHLQPRVFWPTIDLNLSAAEQRHRNSAGWTSQPRELFPISNASSGGARMSYKSLEQFQAPLHAAERTAEQQGPICILNINGA